MLDPLTAVSLAGTVVQFVSFSHEIVSMGKQIYKSSSGTSTESIELKSMIGDLVTIHEDLQRAFAADGSRVNSKQEETLISLVNLCEPIYEELRGILESGQATKQGVHRKWRSFAVAVKMHWKEDQIHDMEKRLGRLQNQIDSHLISEIRSQQVATMRLLQELAEQFRRLELNRTQDIHEIVDGIRRSFNELQYANNSAISWGQSGLEGINVQGTARRANGVLLELSKQANIVRTLAGERMFLGELVYAEMKNRHVEIKEAHLETFEWIFSSSENRPTATHFIQWLTTAGGVF